jgi:hypothetical protein
MHATTSKELRESSIRNIMEQLSLSEEEARGWLDRFEKRYYSERECIYDFLRESNPKVRGMELDESCKGRIATLAAEMQISERTATALVITGDVLVEGGMRQLRKKKTKPSEADFREMLGVTVPIPQDVMDALGTDDG